ncbi:TrmH family RNA methyltransferase [Natronospira proteinivora]|uniref:tRNA (cytidine/uridine-2'-O-)-methyltransferase TrmJ n=1 Tax=Natronospira proteinivora TaxID=1807133 RepID=A0ABT1G4Q0_9GAMM|nr:RNA methyltransferase [Natronospira proteinivora]MCP1726268.1 TrmH family RNA methyltransferase [Natronospira proteinivora]
MRLDTRIVLVGTTHPGNIGSAARAMKTMGLHDLALVSPRKPPDDEARARASGALDVLENAQIHEDLDAAIADCHLVIGASARTRRLGAEPVAPPVAARSVVELPPGTRAAILLGRERTGLTNEELDRCHQLVHIPANPDYSSLNLAAATQVLSYELRMAALAATGETGLPEPSRRSQPTATAEELEHLYQHFESVLEELGFLDRSNPRQLMRRIRRLFGRALPDRNEVNIFRGILSAVQGRGSAPRRAAERRGQQDPD